MKPMPSSRLSPAEQVLAMALLRAGISECALARDPATGRQTA